MIANETMNFPHLHFSTGQFKCSGHEGLTLTWCEHLKQFIEDGEDAYFLHTDHHIVVPIFPTAGIFGEVWIGVDIGNGSALMSLGFTPDIGKPYSVQLGFWNPGEGMGSIRLVILDYIKSRLDPHESFKPGKPIQTKCPSSAHGLRQSRQMREKVGDLRWKWECLWNIVMEKACTPCIELTDGASGDNFGIDDSITTSNKPWRT